MLYSVVIIYSLVNYGWQFPTIGKSAATRQLHAFKPIYIYIYIRWITLPGIYLRSGSTNERFISKRAY